MNLKILIFITTILSILFTTTISQAPKISSFQQLGQYHCQIFPIQILYRLSSGTLAEKFGNKYSQIDCYVRQFVNQDGQNIQESQDQEDQQQDAQQNTQDQQEGSDDSQSSQQDNYQYPTNDPIIQKYAQGIKKCLPEGVDPVEGTYKIWRFYRYVFQHDYTFQWMRAKIRSSLGYQAQKPNAWMDGQQNQKRLRLDKLFSNQFYDYVDKLMFRDFLFPVMTFMKKNVVVGLQGSVTNSGKPILLQYIESRNVLQEVFKPIVFVDSQTKGQIFTYTLPGIPLFLGGSSGNFMWAFTGVLIDRSNIQQIQTVGNKFYHHGVQQWIHLRNVSITVPVKDSQPFTCTFMHSSYGTLYEKHNASGKVSEYIARWHQNQPRVRNLFTDVFNLIRNTGKAERDFDFPFNSILIANHSGLFHYICQQRHPSYFIYPDLASQPDALPQRWTSQPKKGAFVIANTHLTTIHQQDYLKKQILNPTEQQIVMQIRRLGRQKVDKQKIWNLILSISTDPLVKKRKQLLIFIYRKSKFVFFPEQQTRKQCDQLISVLQKWDNNLSSQLYSPVFLLWDYFFKDYTFNHVSTSKLGSHIVKHRVLTDNYWTGQPDLWKKVVSYGECDSSAWFEQKWDVRLNNTGLNCTCFFNVLRGLNRTRQILRNSDGSINQNIALAPFNTKKTIDLSENYVGPHIQQAFNNLYSKNLGFVAELENPEIVYLRSYKQIEQNIKITIGSVPQKESKNEEPSTQSIQEL